MKHLYLESYSWRENLKFFGILEPEKASAEEGGKAIDTRAVLYEFLKTTLGFEDPRHIEIQRVHWIGKSINGKPSPDLDSSGGSPTVKDICLNYDLIDIWRIRNPDAKSYTWRQKKPLIQRRLDFWLISDSCQDEVEDTTVKTALKSDHSAIIISFNSLVAANICLKYL